MEKAYGPDRPDVAMALVNLAGFYFDHGRHAEAAPLYDRFMSLVEA